MSYTSNNANLDLSSSASASAVVDVGSASAAAVVDETKVAFGTTGGLGFTTVLPSQLGSGVPTLISISPTSPTSSSVPNLTVPTFINSVPSETESEADSDVVSESDDDDEVKHSIRYPIRQRVLKPVAMPPKLKLENKAYPIWSVRSAGFHIYEDTAAQDIKEALNISVPLNKLDAHFVYKIDDTATILSDPLRRSVYCFALGFGWNHNVIVPSDHCDFPCDSSSPSNPESNSFSHPWDVSMPFALYIHIHSVAVNGDCDDLMWPESEGRVVSVVSPSDPSPVVPFFMMHKLSGKDFFRAMSRYCVADVFDNLLPVTAVCRSYSGSVNVAVVDLFCARPIKPSTANAPTIKNLREQPIKMEIQA